MLRPGMKEVHDQRRSKAPSGVEGGQACPDVDGVGNVPRRSMSAAPASRSTEVVGLEHAMHRPSSRVADAELTLPESHGPLLTATLPITIVAAIASVFALSWSQAFLVPLLLGIIIA